MLTVGAFIVAIAILVAVHEWGHFAMARLCGVRVLCFSIGFGPRLWGNISRASGTEYRVGMVPLGGYVQMLDEREGPVEAHELHLAFNRQTLLKRALIVSAGPLANFALAVLLYAVVNVAGVQAPQARVGRPLEHSVAAQAGFKGGELITAVAGIGGGSTDIASFDDLQWQLAQAALEHRDLVLQYRMQGDSTVLERTLPLSGMDVRQADAGLFQQIGLVMPFAAARIGELMPGEAAQAAGLQSGDLVLEVEGQRIIDGAQLRELIRQSGRTGEPALQHWRVERHGRFAELQVQPRRATDQGQSIGRVGAMIGAMPVMVTVHYGPVSAVQRAFRKTWEVSALTLRMMGQIVTGASSYRNLSGPITIADYAGRSASLGLTPFVLFLAMVSISLGVLNLLPVPVLDGGHLMYYLWEGVTGRSLSLTWMSRLQRVGVALLLVMMSVAIFNDITRLLT